MYFSNNVKVYKVLRIHTHDYSQWLDFCEMIEAYNTTQNLIAVNGSSEQIHRSNHKFKNYKQRVQSYE